MHCPNCGSKSVKKSSAVYEQGQSSTSRRSNGIWLSSRGKTGAWTSRGSSTRITKTAERNAPPAAGAQIMGCAGTLGFGMALFTGTSLDVGFGPTLFLSLAAGIGLTIAAGYWTSDLRRVEQETYARQWYCSRCGDFFTVPDTSPAEPSAPRLSSNGMRVSSPIVGLPYRPNREAYAERVVCPVQRAKAETERDAEGLLLIGQRADPNGRFDPQHPGPLDLGIVSRLSSLGYLHWHPERDEFSITARGKQRLSVLIARVASAG